MSERRNRKKQESDMIELGKLLLDEERAMALSEWLDDLVKERRKAQQRIADEKAADELDEQRCEKVMEIARALGERHGPLEDMDSWEQAKAACASWEAQAGYFDVDEYFEMDDDWRETWNTAYSDRIEELRRARG